MDLYSEMGDELRSLFKDLLDAKKTRDIEEKMGRILAKAAKIGGPIYQDAKQLHADVAQFLKNPKNQITAALMKAHALRLEQETREI